MKPGFIIGARCAGDQGAILDFLVYVDYVLEN